MPGQRFVDRKIAELAMANHKAQQNRLNKLRIQQELAVDAAAIADTKQSTEPPMEEDTAVLSADRIAEEMDTMRSEIDSLKHDRDVLMVEHLKQQLLKYNISIPSATHK